MKKPTDNDKKTLFYKMTFDPLVARLYNNKKCNQCYGRGYVEIETPHEGLVKLRKHQSNQTIRIYCNCVNKKVKKQRQEELHKGENK